MNTSSCFAFILALFLHSTVSYSGERTPESDSQKNKKYKIECEHNKFRSLFGTVECGDQFHHYSSDSVTNQENNESLRIGTFNLLHPGMKKTAFKDFALVAKIINHHFDLLSGLELISVVGDEAAVNEHIYKLIKPIKDQLNEKIQEKVRLSSQLDLEALDDDDSTERIRIIDNKLIDLASSRSFIQKELLSASRRISTYSKKGFTIFGWEIFKRRRLKRLRIALKLYSLKKSQFLPIEAEISRLKIEKEEILLAQNSQDQNASETQILIDELSLQITKLDSELKEQVKKLYRPGYLTLLQELRKYDPSWSLILSPRGEALEKSHTQELVGFYYRNGAVKPTANEHCADQYSENRPFACFPNFYENFMEKNLANVFSRPPFMASFSAGNFDFAILASHVIFTSPSNPEVMKKILLPTFGVENYKEVKGLTKSKYARVAEIKATLDFIKKFKESYAEKDVIYTGDFNLEKKEKFWPELMAQYNGEQLYINDPTSIALVKVRGTSETNGVTSNYDHFIFNPHELSECQAQGEVISFYNDELIKAEMEKSYLIREKSSEEIDQLKSLSLSKFEEEQAQYFELVRGKLQPLSEAIIETQKAKLIERVFDSQLTEKGYYKVYQQVLSDHLPIRLNCHK